MKLPVTLRALRYRNFQLFFSGQLISLIGTWMQNVAQAWLVYKLTGSPVQLGLVSFANQIPVGLIAPLGGIVADRFPRQRIVIATQTASMLLALVLAALTLTGAVRVPHIYVLAALLGIVNAFDIPARQAFIMDMVGREHLMNAIALNSSMFNASRVLGPAVAGILVARIGEGWCFFANGISYIAVIIGLMLMRVSVPQTARRSGSPLADIIEGFRFVTANRPVHYLMMLIGILSITGSPVTVLMPIFADRILHGGARGLGMLMGAGGMGAVAGALLLASRQSVHGLGRWVAMATGSFGACMIAFALSHTFWLSFAVLLPIGLSMMVQMGSTNTLLQTMSPDHLRGRVISVYSMAMMGLAPVGALLGGIAADRWGAPATLIGGGVICMLGAAAFGRRLPSIRAEARQLIETAHMSAPVK